MQIVVVTKEVSHWQTFAQELERHGHHVSYVENLEQLTARMNLPETALEAVIWDDMIQADALFSAVAAVMQRDVRIHQACRWLGTQQDFHEAAEGLGMLPAITESCDAEAAKAFLVSVDQVTSLLPR